MFTKPFSKIKVDEELKKEYRKKLIDYYKKKGVCTTLLRNKELLNNQIEEIENEINYLNSIGEFKEEIKKLEYEKTLLFKKIIKGSVKRRRIELFISNMEQRINTLEDIEKEYLELKFKEQKSNRIINIIMSLSETTRFNLEHQTLIKIMTMGGIEYVESISDMVEDIPINDRQVL